MSPKKRESRDLSVPDVTPQIQALESRCDELENLVNRLTGADAKKTQTEIQGLTQRLDELQNTAALKKDLDESLKGENGELPTLRKEHDEKIDATNKRLDELQNAGALQKDLDERTAEFRAADEKINATIADLEARHQALKLAHEEFAKEEKTERQQDVTDLRNEIKQLREHADSEFAREAADLKAAVAKLDSDLAALDKLHKSLNDALDNKLSTELNKVNMELLQKLDTAETNQDAAREALRENREAAEEAFREEMDNLDKKNTQIRELATADLMEHVTNIHNTSTYALHVVERSCSNATTIKWRIQASELEGKMRVSMFSDLFHCHGARNMKLELRIDKHVDGTSESLGDSSLYLWAPQGNRISFRLWVGEPVGPRVLNPESAKGKSMSCDFNYLQEGRYGAKGFFQLAHFLTGHLMVGVDILEVENEVQYWDGTPGHVLDPRGFGKGKKKEEEKVTLADGRVVDKATAELINPTPTKLTAVCMSNMRINETLYEQMQLIKSRYCKRSEWKITHAEELLAMYPPGRALCSKPFCAGGLEDLQFVIYPRGMGGADGYCSCLISAPAGTFIKGNLYMGKQSRSLEHTWGERGQYGRANFCRWDNAVENDTVVACLEILECMGATVQSGGLRLTSQVPQGALVDVQEIPRAPQPETQTPAGKRALYGNLSPVDAPVKGSKVKKDKSLAWLRKMPPAPSETSASFNETHSGAFGASAGLSTNLSAPDIRRPQSSGTLPGIGGS
jgi:hypothetical protein